MVKILLVSSRPKDFAEFVAALARGGGETTQVTEGRQALAQAAEDAPQVVVVDHALPDMEPLALVYELLTVNALVNTAVCSALSEEEFHERSEGLGVLLRLPLAPGGDEAERLLEALKGIS